MDDLISRQAAIDTFYKATSDGDKFKFCVAVLKAVPSAYPKNSACWGCNCPKMEWHFGAMREDGE